MFEFVLTYSSLIAMIAVVYSVLCTEPGEIFSGLYKWLNKKLMARQLYVNEKYEGIDNGKPIYIRKYVTRYFSYRKSVRNYEWLFKPLIGCERCVGGQMALWFYLLMSFFVQSYYDPFEHVALISFTIFFTVIFKTLYLWLKHLQEKM